MMAARQHARGPADKAGFLRPRWSGPGAATFRRAPGFDDMKTFLKVALIVLLALVALKLLPILMVPVVLTGVLLLGLLGLALGGLTAAAGVGVAVVVALAIAAVAIVAALSPIWLPVLAIVGLIALIKRSSRAKAKA
jgi:hypothetical protein